jgi:hypothetical protein
MTDKAAHFNQALTLAQQLPIADRLRLIAELSATLAQELESEPPATSASANDNREPMVGPLALIDRPGDRHFGHLVANGIDVETGEPLLILDAAAAKRLATLQSEEAPRQAITKARLQASQPSWGMVFGRNYQDLHDAGWAVIVHAEDDSAILKALWPLIVHRSAAQGLTLPAISFRDGERCGDWLARHGADPKCSWHPLSPVRLPVLLYETGDTCAGWLARHGVYVGQVDPSRGVPFYLLMAGRPGPLHPADRVFIPFSFQYDLDLFWGVGRLCFTHPDGTHDTAGYAAYAERTVQFEQSRIPPYGRHIVYAATRHARDEPTIASADGLVQPLAMGRPIDNVAPISERFAFTQAVLQGLEATRDALVDILSGIHPGGRPALLFTATHGAGLRVADPRLPLHQGALICADWSGTGPVRREHWLAAEDLPAQLAIEGMITVCFACYGAGCPTADQYAIATGRMLQVAPRALVAMLPQRLLTAGALAVIGHVDRAWNYSFSAPNLGVAGQTQGFEDLLGRLMSGQRVGHATDTFNLRQAAFASQMSEFVNRASFATLNPAFGLDEIGHLWKAFHDARGYALLGDPAVRLSVDDQPV